jgi:branched-subunit amino acid aminotransferase/4-amino-4-deoxychorismate lyase
MNIGVVTHDRKLLVPPFDATLAGVTITRVMELAQQVSRRQGPAAGPAAAAAAAAACITARACMLLATMRRCR